MKKLFLSLVAAIVAATATYAQSTLVATLSHGSDITMFYGSNALRDAHNAAVSGDVINLSGGAFQAVDITKAVTIRGAGVDDATPTYILSSCKIKIPDTDTGRLSMEGVRCPNVYIEGILTNAFFLKCVLIDISSYNGSAVKLVNVIFADCKFTGTINWQGSGSIQFLNCFLSGFTSGNTTGNTLLNCIIIQPYWENISSIANTQLINCIISGDSRNNLPSSSVAKNCIAINSPNCFSTSPSNTDCKHATFEEVFKDFTGTYSDDQTFELTDEAKTKYLGTDGTQVGLYGGVMPYTSTPSYPRITKMNVANKTTADGKLSVEIEVSAAQ